jgi:hypothetical protein
MKDIKTLVDVLSVYRWRQEAKCANLLRLTDEQRKEVVDTLRTLDVKLSTETWGVGERDVYEKKNKK